MALPSNSDIVDAGIAALRKNDSIIDSVAWNKDNPDVLVNSERQQPYIERSELPGAKGLNVLTTCVFIVGVIAGTGFLTMPGAVEDTGWIGLVLMFVSSGVSSYTGTLLGKCWMLVLAERPELKENKVGDPYPTIAEAAYGKPARYVVTISIFCTMFGGTVVYLLISAENIRELIPAGHENMNLCYLVLIVAGVLTPLTWMGTPKDFWGIAAAASLVTGTASLILLIDVIVTTKTHDVIHSKVDIVSFFTGYGTICFGFNGHAAFPTFQSDMKQPSEFGKAVGIGYIFVLLMYVPSAAAGYVLFGKTIHPNIILNMEAGPPKTLVTVLMTSHLLFGIIIILNPITQAIEGFLGIPKRNCLFVDFPCKGFVLGTSVASLIIAMNFTWKRLVSRTSVMAAVVFVAESVPHFSSILSLVGGSTITICAIICPPLFYMKLVRSTTVEQMKIPLSLHRVVLHIEIIFIGIVAGIATTYSAITDLATNKFTVPCYVDPVRASQ